VDVQPRVRRLGPNSFGEELSSGVVTDCYLGLLVDQPLAATLPTPGSLLVVGPSALLDGRVRQPDGRAVYDLLTGHPDRTSRDLVFLADLAVELRTWQGHRLRHPGRRRRRRGRGGRAAGPPRPGPCPLVPRAVGLGRQGAWLSRDGLRPLPAARPPQQLACRAVHALATPHQRTPAWRPVPVAHRMRSRRRTVPRFERRPASLPPPCSGDVRGLDSTPWTPTRRWTSCGSGSQSCASFHLRACFRASAGSCRSPCSPA
jgi:hypothetical protein